MAKKQTKSIEVEKIEVEKEYIPMEEVQKLPVRTEQEQWEFDNVGLMKSGKIDRIVNQFVSDLKLRWRPASSELRLIDPSMKVSKILEKILEKNRRL